MRRSFLLLLLLAGCGREDAPRPAPTGHDRMVAALREIAARLDDEHDWIGSREARGLRRALAELPADAPPDARWTLLVRLAVCESWLGDFEAATARLAEAEALLPRLGKSIPDEQRYQFLLGAGLVWLRLGEVRNCCARNRPESCILPLRDGALHTDPEGSRRAVAYFRELADRFPARLTPRWLLNLACMTLGEEAPERYRLPPTSFASAEPFPRFPNIAGRLGFDFRSLAGSVAAEDFDGDGFLDLAVCSWDPRVPLRLFRNDRRGGFVERGAAAGLQGLLGGANLVQADYDNDGRPDLLVLRGTWLERNGRHPKSLLRNRGDGTFTDVTFDAGLGKVHYPSETAAWADYDGDGDLDLYVGNEHGASLDAPSQLFRNNGDGTFTDVAPLAGVENRRYAKGVSWGDYDNDGDPDLYVSNLKMEENRLYRNNGDGTFTDVAPALGVTRPLSGYAAWFWDVNNDGHLDLFATSYQGGVEAAAAPYFGASPPPDTELPCLYLGDGRGGFQESAAAWGIARPLLAMGVNFGDLDNDGWLDVYFGTGYPDYEALLPNVMLRNREGRGFADVTFAGGFGHLQKGHGIAFADLDNDGDQDVVEQMGGAYRGDEAASVVYQNPGFGNRWITLKLIGAKANRSAIGARVRVDVDDGGPRRIHRHVSSGASFGANPLRLEIGLGRAKRIERLEIAWPGSRTVQVFKDVAVDRFLEITEGRDQISEVRKP